MQPEQKKKVFIMAGILGLCLIGVIGFLFLSKTKEDPNAPPASASTAPPPSSGMPANASTAGAPAPPMTPSPNMAMPPASAVTPATTSSMLPGVEVVVDPFKGCPKITKPRPSGPKTGWTSHTPVETAIPVPAIPGVSPVTNPGPTGGSANDGVDTGFNIDPWGAALPAQRNVANANLGRNAGWIASETQGRVTAYFDLGNGAIQPVSVGSVINGWRVKAIYKEYMLLTEEATGREDKVMLQSVKSSGAQLPSVNAVSRNNGWE